ncbi:uncharacterized protein RCC_05749 [Ramularia collo-cygni]|uniref:Uncharacterized protein n=1 Tax=Ramularia collo-cygni TaxID=112498 RepID=A0A2D3VGR5_9PEZI|nr:uncharacterized protein RCC_05749 [Ramularia collo-cygni]CZT19893.1 uncharacterized protein RCC_05749 [Ramularia collo-cygni]
MAPVWNPQQEQEQQQQQQQQMILVDGNTPLEDLPLDGIPVGEEHTPLEEDTLLEEDDALLEWEDTEDTEKGGHSIGRVGLLAREM